MSVLRLVGLVAIAGIVASVFAVVYPKFLSMYDFEKAKDAADELVSAIDHVISSGGSPTTVEIEIPDGYELTFKENRMEIDGITREYPYQIGGENLGPGKYELSITIEDQIVMVSKAS